MHMADALLSPAVGGTMWAISAGTLTYCSGKVRKEMDDRKIPLMGVLGAFIFAAQMINFTIPFTGSSGHLGGGLILAILLGPCAAFLTIASVLVVQAFFFADGGLLALGCNIFNLGFFPAFIAYPAIYKRLTGNNPTTKSITLAALIAAIIGLQLGALGVVVETAASGISSLPFSTFVAVMQPIHLAIGSVEGLITASVVIFVYKARPEIISSSVKFLPGEKMNVRVITLTFLTLAIMTGGVVSWFASNEPDGLEWSISRISGREKLKGPDYGLHAVLVDLQEKVSILPGYSLSRPVEPMKTPVASDEKKSDGSDNRLDTSISGLVGGMAALVLSLLIGRATEDAKRSSIRSLAAICWLSTLICLTGRQDFGILISVFIITPRVSVMPKNILKITGIICCTTILCFAAPAFAAQPLITDDTGTMGVMKFQLETGTEFGWNREDNNGVATDAPYQLLSLTLTAGVLDSLGLVLALPFCWQQVEENGLKTYDNGGLNDLSLALKWRFLELGPASFALKPSITIPSGDYNRGLSDARPAYGATLISTVEFKPVTISANAGYTIQKYTDADRSTCRENLWNLSMSGTAEVIKGLQMVAADRHGFKCEYCEHILAVTVQQRVG